jgi:hypothetical protein
VRKALKVPETLKVRFSFSYVRIYFLNCCRMELAMNMVFGLNIRINARFIR